VAVDHRLLDGIQVAGGAEAFDGDDVGAVELEEELDAGIDGEIAEGVGSGQRAVGSRLRCRRFLCR
jgi:hypothetical protein